MESQGDEVLARLDDLIATLRLAFSAEISESLASIRDHEVQAAILDEVAEEWVASRELQRIVSSRMDVTDRTVRNKLSDLVRIGLLRTRGPARSREYLTSSLAY